METIKNHKKDYKKFLTAVGKDEIPSSNLDSSANFDHSNLTIFVVCFAFDNFLSENEKQAKMGFRDKAQ